MMSDNLTMLFPNASLSLFGTRLATRQLFSILSSLIILPSVWLNDLSLLSYFSGNIITSLYSLSLNFLWPFLSNYIRTRIFQWEELRRRFWSGFVCYGSEWWTAWGFTQAGRPWICLAFMPPSESTPLPFLATPFSQMSTLPWNTPLASLLFSSSGYVVCDTHYHLFIIIIHSHIITFLNLLNT